METKILTCIGCPLGCELTATIAEDGRIFVKGNTCIRGEQYALSELTNPRRILTTTVRVVGGVEAMVSVKTKGDIPKEKIMEGVKALKDVEVNAPVEIGDVLLKNLVGTGVEVVATKTVGKSE